MRSFALVPIVLLALVFACAHDTPRSAAPSSSAGDSTASFEAPAARVVTVKTRSHVVHIHAGKRYTIEALSGTVVAADLDAEQFKSRFPELWDVAHDVAPDVNDRNQRHSIRRMQERQASRSRP
jgi:hypothetical protein